MQGINCYLNRSPKSMIPKFKLIFIKIDRLIRKVPVKHNKLTKKKLDVCDSVVTLLCLLFIAWVTRNKIVL